MKFQVLISTVDDKFIERGYDVSNSLVINQLISKNKSQYDLENVISINEKGLSKSRNRALTGAIGEICLIADDDVVFKKDVQEIIIKSFEENPEADVITFQIETPEGGAYKNYKNKSFWHGYKSLLSVSSVEIALRRNSILSKNILYDEGFGLGGKYPTGEENIFLTDLLKKGMKIKYIPLPIVIHAKESSGGDFKNNQTLIEAKGAVFYRIFGIFSYLISMIFAIKKAKSSDLSIYTFYKVMLIGVKKYKRD